MAKKRKELDVVLDRVRSAVRHAANKIARRAGYRAATRIIHDARYAPGSGRVERHEEGGYVVAKTGKMVPRAYYRRARGHGVYYRESVTVVRMNTDV